MRFNRTVVAAAILATSCGGGSSPAAPTPTGTPAPGGGLLFQATRYTLIILALDCRDNPATQGATFAVSLAVALRPDTNGWTAVPVNSNGTLSVRFLPAGVNGSEPAQVLTGSATGFVDDEGAPASPIPNGTRLTMDGSVPLSGVLVNGAAIGQIDGPVVFTKTGISTTCGGGSVTWVLNR